MAPAAFEKRVLRGADCHDGPRAHTRPCDTFGSLRFHRLGPPRWWGELRSAEGPRLASSLPSCPSNKKTRPPALVNQCCAPLRGLLASWLSSTYCVLWPPFWGHWAFRWKRPARPRRLDAHSRVQGARRGVSLSPRVEFQSSSWKGSDD